MTELLPCPFCGGEAETLTAESMHGGYLFGIMCSDCCSRGDVYNTEAEAIAAWNTRYERTCRNDKDKFAQFFNGYYFVCSECSWNIPNVKNAGVELAAELMRFCPYCGAKVVGE